MSLLELKSVTVAIQARQGSFTVVDDVSLSLDEGEMLGLVGESGSGKSMLASAIMGIFPTVEASVTSGEILLAGEDLTKVKAERYRQIRGNDITIILQDSLASLNPVLTMATQVAETVTAHDAKSDNSVRERVLRALRDCSFPSPETRMHSYPHQLSGGMRQRGAAAMALVNRPRLLIADEPTTALDVTVQAQFLRLLAHLNRDNKLAVVLISHDLALVSQVATKIAVMYSGRVMESGPSGEVTTNPRHPYTSALLRAIPRLDEDVTRLPTIPGFAPAAHRKLSGCPFRDRCPAVMKICSVEPPTVKLPDFHTVACWLHADADHAEEPHVS